MRELLPILVQTEFTGRQNCLIGVAEAINPTRNVILPEIPPMDAAAINYLCLAGRNESDFWLSADLISRHYAVHIGKIPHGTIPVFLNYSVNYLADAATTLMGMAVKKLRPETLLVNIDNPAYARDVFDLVACTPGVTPDVDDDKILRLDSVPNRVTPEKLTAARQKWGPRLIHDRKPLLSVIVGGAVVSNHRGGPSLEPSATQIDNFIHHAHSLLDRYKMRLALTTSRRTTPDMIAALQKHLIPRAVHAHIFEPKAPGSLLDQDLIFGLYACGDVRMVTNDSMIMLSESSDAEGLTLTEDHHDTLLPKHRAFLETMIDNRRVHYIHRGLDHEEQCALPKVRAAQAIADRVNVLAA